MTKHLENYDKPRIWVFIAHCMSWEGNPKGKDLALAYDMYMNLVGYYDWVVFIDHDAMVTTPRWLSLIEMAIEQKPDAGAFVGVTNRLNPDMSYWQMAGEVGLHEHSMILHRQIGATRQDYFGAALEDVTDIGDPEEGPALFSGFFFCVSKAAWTELGELTSGNFDQVDWQIHLRLRESGYRIYMLPGLYVYHWFRYERRPTALQPRVQLEESIEGDA